MRFVILAALAVVFALAFVFAVPYADGYPTRPMGVGTSSANTWTGIQSFSAAIKAASGNFTTPGYTFTTDPDTGMYLNSADDLRISEPTNSNMISMRAFGVDISGLGNTSVRFNATGAVFYGKILADTNAWAITDPGNAGAIPVTTSGVCNMTSGASGQTRTLAAPTFQGERLELAMNVDGGGDIVVTVSAAFNQTSNTTITFNDAGDHVELVAVLIASALRWRIVINNGTTLG
jgi:hypothetical protein